MRKKYFFPVANCYYVHYISIMSTTFTTPWSCQKYMFLFQHYVYYMMIIYKKYTFFILVLRPLSPFFVAAVISTTSTTPWLWKNMFYFSFQQYGHYVLITTENTFIFILTIRSLRNKFSGSIRFVQYTVFNSQEFHWSLKCYFFPQEVQCFYKIRTCHSNFTDRNFSGVLHALLLLICVWSWNLIR